MKKLLDREPTEEMIIAACNNEKLAQSFWHKLFDAAPELTVDMEPVAWFIDVTTNGVSTGRYEVAADEFCGYEHGTIPLYSAAQLATIGSERDLARGEAEVLQAENERLNKGWHEANCAALKASQEVSELFSLLSKIHAGTPCSMDELSAMIAKHGSEKHD